MYIVDPDCQLFTFHSINSGKWETTIIIHSFQCKPMHLSSYQHSSCSTHGKYMQVQYTQ